MEPKTASTCNFCIMCQCHRVSYPAAKFGVRQRKPRISPTSLRSACTRSLRRYRHRSRWHLQHTGDRKLPCHGDRSWRCHRTSTAYKCGAKRSDGMRRLIPVALRRQHSICLSGVLPRTSRQGSTEARYERAPKETEFSQK